MEDQEIRMSQLSSKIRYPVKSLTVLVVDDDIICLAIVAAHLKSLKYQVVTVKHPNEALSTLKIKASSFDLVIIDVHMPDMNGFELQKIIDQEFKLPVVFMSADGQDGVMVKGLQSGASFFIVKPVSSNDLKDLWQFAFANKKGKAILEEIETAQQTVEPENPCNGNTLISDVNPDEGQERKRKLPMNEDINDDFGIAVTKKPKFVWTKSLHIQFLEAIRSIGVDKAVPKKILERMNVNGLTREHVASHLQKYRLVVKKVTATSSRIQFDQLQSSPTPELQSDFLSRKQSVGGYFSISKPPNFLSSSLNHRHHFSSNSTPGSENALLSLLYSKNNSKQQMIQTPVSIYDTESFVYTNKPNFPFYGDFSKGVDIAQEKPQIAAEKGINNGFSIDMLSSQKVGSFNHRNNYWEANLKGLAKPGTSERKGLQETKDFYFKNELNNGMGNETMINTVPVMSGTCGDNVPKLGVSSSNYQNQLTYHHLNGDNNGGQNVEIFGSLDDLSGSRNSLFMQQFNDHCDDSSTWMNQANIQSQTQQQTVGEELIPNIGISENPSSDQCFQSFDPDFFEFDEQEYLQSLLNPGKEGGDRHPGTF